jgi:flagellar biogenesis protein FliO
MNRKFIRRARRNLLVREKAIEILSKVLLIGISILVCLWMTSGAHAASVSITGVSSQELGDGSRAIDIALSEKIDADNVTVEFDRNFIQVSMKGVSAYPARTESINEGALEKVFTYQYQPDLARARVLLKTMASTVKGRSSWKLTSDGLRLTVRPDTATVQTVSDVVKNKSASASGSSTDKDDERIVQEILSESKNGPTPKPVEAAPLVAEKKAVGEDQTLFPPKVIDDKPKEGSATRIFASLLLVIGVIGACAVAFRRFALGKGMPFQRQARVIETIATQGIGPKRSVAVIKVLDQYMVIGMAGDSMTMLANLGADVNIDRYIDSVGGPGSGFTDTLEGALSGVNAAGKTDTAGPPLTQRAQIELGVRTSIKKRLAGFKPL